MSEPLTEEECEAIAALCEAQGHGHAGEAHRYGRYDIHLGAPDPEYAQTQQAKADHYAALAARVRALPSALRAARDGGIEAAAHEGYLLIAQTKGQNHDACNMRQTTLRLVQRIQALKGKTP